MGNASAWRTAGSLLVRNWGAWLVFVLIMTAVSAVPSSLVSGSAVHATPQQAAGILGELGSVIVLELIVGTFMNAALLSLLKDAADVGSAPTAARFFAGGWDNWSWLWRGIGFVIVVAIAYLVAEIIITSLTGLLGSVGTPGNVAGTVLVIGFFVGTLLVALPWLFWSYIGGFYLRPQGYWRTARHVWQAFLAQPGRIMGPVLAFVGVAFVVEIPAIIGTAGSAMTGSLAPSITSGPGFLITVLILEALGIWIDLTIMVLVKEWLGALA